MVIKTRSLPPFGRGQHSKNVQRRTYVDEEIFNVIFPGSLESKATPRYFSFWLAIGMGLLLQVKITWRVLNERSEKTTVDDL